MEGGQPPNLPRATLQRLIQDGLLVGVMYSVLDRFGECELMHYLQLSSALPGQRLPLTLTLDVTRLTN